MVQLVTTWLAVLIAAVGIAHAKTPLERGSYLVNAVMACDGCHTPRVPSGFIMDKRFSGGSGIWDTPAYTVRGSNITPDQETGSARGAKPTPSGLSRTASARTARRFHPRCPSRFTRS